MADSKAANTSTTRRRKRCSIIALAAAALLLAVAGFGLVWFNDYGSAMAHPVSPLHNDNRLNHVMPNLFWTGMTKDEATQFLTFGLGKSSMKASTNNRWIVVISDQRTRFRPNPAPALRVEIDFDENDKVIASRWSRITESQ